MKFDPKNPKVAREFVRKFKIPSIGPLSYLVLVDGRRIKLRNMTDADAVLAAQLLYECQLEAEQLLANDEGHVQ